ncbi:hypothetical protein BKA66DRAFT_604208 [Pyrenochaeta sp. MPI-SDFR-AT-0127]|nr:hypothetical protein BKA66DRAFT_604208 [Pyrenochaeta sp. MPI-SDFR-AT-0127]
MFKKARPFISFANAQLLPFKVVAPIHHCDRTTQFTGRSTHSGFSTYSSFPATLLHLNAGVAFKQYEFERQAQSHQLGIYENSEESKDDPQKADIWTNCLVDIAGNLMPNTFLMQEIIRTATDYYCEDVDTGASVERPFIFTIPKGTVLPTNLLLRRENVSQFTLQPSLPTPPKEFHSILEEFYSKFADKRDAKEWLVDHKYEDAIACDNETKWMSR